MSKCLPKILLDLSSLSASVVSSCYCQARTALATVISVLFNTLNSFPLLAFTHTISLTGILFSASSFGSLYIL